MKRFSALLATAALLFTPLNVDAQDLLLLGVGGPGAASAPAGLSFTYGNASDATSQTTYTFASQAIGTADPSRVIIVAVASEQSSNSVVNSVSICGVSATKDEGEAASGLHTLELWSAAVGNTGGTSCTIAFTLSTATAVRAQIGWVSILGSTQTTHFAIADANTKTSGGTVASITSGSLSIPTNGYAFVATRIQNGAGAPMTWSQSSGSGAKHMDSNGGTNLSMGTYSSSFTVSGASTFTTAANGGTSLNMRIAGVSWSP